MADHAGPADISQRRPEAIFDSHLHIVDPRFPLVPNKGFVPAVFTCADYLTRVRPLRVGGGAVVSGSFQAFDQSYLLDALALLGPTFVGVTQLPADCSEKQIVALDTAGVRAVRFNLIRGELTGPANIDVLARKVFDTCGWHSEFYLRNADLAELEGLAVDLPKICIDHLGLTAEGFDVLLRLVGAGAHVKASGFMRGNLDVRDALQRIHAVNPQALMFGTDLPGTRAPRHFRPADLALVRTAFGRSDTAKVLRDNAVAFYRPASLPTVTVD